MPTLTVLNSFFLWMLPLASLPVLFHLFYRMRRKQRLFSSLMFFLQADPRLRSRRRIREWLTLFLRVLAIIFLLLALARPVWVGVRGHGAASVVLVVDNSGSMTGPASDGRSKLSIAIEAARALVETLAEDDRVAVLLLVEDPAVPLPLGLTSDRESTLAALAGIRPTEASGMPIRVLGEALTLLRTASTQRREIHVFTDLQKTEWGKEGAVTVPIPVDTELIVHRIAGKSSGGKNLAIGSVIFGKKRIIVGRACSSLVEVMNQGDVDIRTRLCMVDHKGTSLTKEISVPHAQTISVPVVLRPSQPQLEWIHVWIEDDGFENDNHTYVAFTPLARQTVLFVGRPEAFEVLPLALAPESDGSLSGCLPVFCSSDRTPDLLRQKDVPAALVTTWEEMPGWPSSDPDWNTLRDFVSRGGVLLIVPPVPVATGSTRLPAWLGSEPQAARVAAEGLALVILDPANPLWDDIRDTSGKPRFTGVRAFRYYPLLPKPEAVGLVGTANGDVVLAQQRVGNGLVFTSGIAFDPKTSNLPLRSSFLAIIHSMVLMTNLPRPNILDLVAGERIVLPAGLVQLSTIAGSSLEWRGKHSDLFTLPRSGIYRAAVGTNITHIVVRFSPAESDPRYIENAPVPVLDGLSHRIVAHDGVEDLAKTIRRQRAGLHFFAPLLALAILVTILEGLVANPAPVPMVGHWFGRWRHATSRFSLGR